MVRGMGHTTNTEPPTLAAIIASNIRRLRAERDWSQSQLSRRLKRRGVNNWTPNLVALVETGRRSPEHLIDLAALCQVFRVPLTELLAAPADQPVRATGSAKQVPMAAIQQAFAGTTPPLEDEEITPPPGEDEAYGSFFVDVSVMNRLGIDAEDVRILTYEMFGEWEFMHARDRRAGVDPATILYTVEGRSDPSVQARRGHATRAMLKEAAAYLADHPMTEIRERQAEAYAQRRAEEDAWDAEQDAAMQRYAQEHTDNA